MCFLRPAYRGRESVLRFLQTHIERPNHGPAPHLGRICPVRIKPGETICSGLRIQEGHGPGYGDYNGSNRKFYECDFRCDKREVSNERIS